MIAAVAIRVDASAEIGIGHLMRCLTLADALKEQGAVVRFVSRRLTDAHRRMVLERGHACVMLTGESKPVMGDLPHAEWLGTDQKSDAEETIAAVADSSWDWIVVDHYALDASWESALRRVVPRVFAIDDLADRVHACDVLLDQNHFPEMRYRELVPSACTMLVGPRYALMRPEYRQYRDTLPLRKGPIERVLVFFGSDPFELANRAAEALSDSRLRDLEVDIVCLGDSSRRTVLEDWAARRGRATIHGPRPHLADLMARADLGVGASGSTTWERMCLGLPSLVVTLAANQIPLARTLADQRLIRLLGHATEVTAEQMRDALLDELAHHRESRGSETIMRLSDGLGTSRVVDTLQRAAASC